MAKAKKKDARSNMRDRAAKRANERKTFGSSYLKFPDGKKVNFFQPKIDKEYALDFLPYVVTVDNHPAQEKGEQWYQRTIWVHSGIGAEDKRYLCLKTVGKRCPICDARAELMRDAGVDSKITDALKPKERELYQVIDLDDEAKGVQLFEFSYHLFGKMLEKEIDKTENSDSTRRKKTVHGGFAMLEGGQTLTLSFSGKTMGGGKPFPECDRIDADDRDDYDEDILDDVLNLDECLVILDRDKLEALFLETDAEGSKKGDDEEEEEEEKPKSKRKVKREEPDEEEEPPKRSRKSKPEPEEEEEEEEEAPPKRSRTPNKKVKQEEPEEEEEEEEVKPKSKRKKPEPEEEEEEEEEVKPKRKGKAKPEPEEEEEEEEEKPKSKRKAKPEPEDEDDDDDAPTCYVKGGKFGVDTDKHTEESDIAYGKKGHVPNCFDCPQWDACKAAKDKAKKKK